jgi:Wings apart-like protein regulation of heterochromatin
MTSSVHPRSFTVTYSRKRPRNIPEKPTTAIPTKSKEVVSQAASSKTRSIWDFEESSDEDKPADETEAQPSPSHGTVHGAAKRKLSETTTERPSKRNSIEKPLGRVGKPGENAINKYPRPLGAFTPQKSRLVGQKQPVTTNSSPIKSPTPPRRSIPKNSTTPSPKSTSKSSNSRSLPVPTTPPPVVKPLSVSQPVEGTPKTPLSTRSRTLSEFSSPRVSQNQEQSWDAIAAIGDTSPSRRRLVDKLREEVSKTPERVNSRRPTPPSVRRDSQTLTIEDEIARALEFSVPVVGDALKPRKESQEEKGTYLSRSRSFLADTSQNQFLEIEGLDDLISDKLPSTLQEEDEDLGVKSWHELKRGGEDKRLLGEMEDLVEDCKPGARLGLRRSSLLQIVDKLALNVTWRRRFKALGLFTTFLRNLANAETDRVIDLLLSKLMF